MLGPARARLIVVVCAVMFFGQGVPDAATAAAPGDELWTKRYNGPSSGDDQAFAMASSPDGSTVFVTGWSARAASANDYATIAYDAVTGERLWLRRYDGPAHGDDFANDLAVSPDGATVFVTGRSERSSTGDDYATIAYDAASGSRLWLVRYNGPGNDSDIARRLAVSPDSSRVYVTGRSMRSASGYDYATIAYDAVTGARLWVRRYNGPGNADDLGYAMSVSPDGARVYVSGWSTGTGSGYDYATIAYDAVSGAPRWVKRYNGPAGTDDSAFSLVISPDSSRVYVTGWSAGRDSSYDYATISYDAANGSRRWLKRYDGPAGAADLATALDVSPDGSKVIVTGESVGLSSASDLATVAYNAATGGTEWLRRYDGKRSGDDFTQALAISPDGQTVFVAGRTLDSARGADYATIAYSTGSGTRRWVSRYNGEGNGENFPITIAVSPDGGRVFVSGWSTGTGTGFDYATIAYRGR